MASYTYSPLQRTYDPKVIGYLPDGLGRDTYIISTNGGLSKSFQNTAGFVTSADFSPRQKPSPLGKGVRKDPAAFKYKADGTGRDSYIIYNSGGLLTGEG